MDAAVADQPLTDRQMLKALRAFKKGDFSTRLPTGLSGVDGDICETFNDVVELNQRLMKELSRLSTTVGKEGKISQRAKLADARGGWQTSVDSVNSLIGDMGYPTAEVARVIGAVATGDLSQTMVLDIDGRPLRGEFLRIGKIVNTMVGQLGSFASEVTRVAREVGTEGKLGGQAEVKGVAGTWKDLTDNVNLMATNLTGQVRNIAEVTTAVANGDLSKKITVDVKGEILELKDTINTMVDQLSSFASEVTRVAREVGTEGKLGGQAEVKGVAGTWKDLTDNVNMMATNLTSQVRNIAEVTTAVANGDLSKKITVDVQGEILELKDTINTMVDQLNSFASEVTRVAREVGTEGKLGGQAKVQGVAGTWKDLTDNVNMMATNLTNQVRGIADVVTAVAKGDLTRKLTVDAKGEIAALADTINGMIITLATFGDQVTNVAREVGIEGKLGGQARVPGAAGLWRDLTDNVNQLAANLTTQVRAIAEVATAVTTGDLTRAITVEASGEVAALKDNINEMIRNLEDTTLKNTEQDWLKTNLARFTRLLQGERDLVTVSNLVLSEMAPLVGAQQGVFYMARRSEEEGDKRSAEEGTVLELLASYAFRERKSLSNRYHLREGLVGQCAFEKQRILLTDVPRDYIQIASGLGAAPPLNIVVLPVLFEGDVQAVLELASFNRFSETHLSFLDQLMESIGIVLNTIATNMRTEDLLTQSQRLTSELQSQQEELRTTNDRLEQQAATLRKSEDLLKTQQEELRRKNDELQEKAQLLAAEKRQVEATNRAVGQAKQAVEEKAEQLALTSRYKSEFLANMSHELRTPLNSMLVLSKLLSDDGDGNLSDKQVEFARTIHSSGNDLLSLINEILDLSKIESGAMRIEVRDTRLDALQEHLRRTFDPVAAEKRLAFTIEIDEAMPASLRTDSMRLQQVLFNLLSNAFKFTHEGGVTLHGQVATSGWSHGHPTLSNVKLAVAFSITDTGIGISPDHQRIIFEAFQQGDGSTSRKYGGTGLGLSICREIAKLLGGEITLKSESGKGSSFTLFIPADLEDGEAQGRTALPAAGALAALPPPDSWQASSQASIVRQATVKGTAPARHAAVEARPKAEADGPTILIVEDNADFAHVLRDIVRDAGMNAILAQRGKEVLKLAAEQRIDGISFDIGLPDVDGWALFDRLKHDPATRHIPVHIISVQEQRRRGLDLGAFGFTGKPAEREVLLDAFRHLREFVAREERHLLVIGKGDDLGLGEMFDDSTGVTLRTVKRAGALRALQDSPWDCVLLDMRTAPAQGIKILQGLRGASPQEDLPVLLYMPEKMSEKTADALSQPMPWITRRAVRQPDRLVHEVATFLHLPVAGLPDAARAAIERVSRQDMTLAGSRVAIVDDDIRNIFSLTSVLEQHRMEVFHAEDGASGIELVRATPDLDLVLVDIMMPGMDGYETIRHIRNMPGRLGQLPLIAVTAKAMAEDRLKCLEAGASDYLAKPVDPGQLVSAVRTWLYNGQGERPATGTGSGEPRRRGGR
ncbi:MAG: response regulator [Sneathiellaceae bacterium]